MISIKKIVTTGATLLVTGSAFGQVSVTSSERAVDASYTYQDQFTDTHLKDADSSDQLGAFNSTAVATIDTFASMTSFVGASGLFTATVDVDRQTTGFGKGFSEGASSDASITIEFSILSATPYDFVLDAEASLNIAEADFSFHVASMSETIVDLNGNQFANAGGGVVALHSAMNGVLQPGDYTLTASASSSVAFIGSGFDGGFPVSFDFTLTIPSPPALVAVVFPAALLGVRRRRSDS